MRIRSIRPEFWTSEDIAALDWSTRLIFIGLWSYVDDNGVGRDNARLIAADLFPLEDDTHGALKQVAGALKSLEARGLITRYNVSGKAYLHITTWDTHQKINRPSGSRYPLPTCDDAIPQDVLTEPSLSPHADSTVGEGEKGRRGEGISTASADADREFDEFWTAYPRKKDKGHGATAYRAARKRVSHDLILAVLEREKGTTWARRSPEHIPYPATWLRSDPWNDEPDRPASDPYPEGGTREEQDAWAARQPRAVGGWS